jgi:hypothetical protein
MWLGGLLVLGLGVSPAASPAGEPIAHAAVTCADYPDQAAAQRAADTRDPDGDGIYCESLPCPCSSVSGGGEDTGGGPAEGADPAGCTRPRGLQRLVFSAAKYPHIRAHFRAAVRKGWPRRLVVNRAGADERRDRLLRDVPTRPGLDRDEYPPAVGRGSGRGLQRGSDPLGWKADVRHVESSENRSHGSVLGADLRRFCNGTRFRYVFR